MALAKQLTFVMALTGAILDCSTASAANTIVMDSAQACSGFSSTAVRASGPIRFNNYSLSVESNGSLNIQENGVLLRKIQSFNYSDYSKCILDLTKIMVGITAPSQKIPVDIFDKVRMGDFGTTALSYLRTTLGPPNEVTVIENPGLKEASFVSDGYIIYARYLPRENNQIVSISVVIDKTSTARRGEVVIDGYWNRSNDVMKLGAPDSMKPGAVLGVSLMKDKFLGDCYPSVEGGIITNSDPTYSCNTSGPHSQGWIAVRVHLEKNNGGDIDGYDLTKLREQVQDGPDSSWPLSAEQTRRFERAAGISRSDEKSTKLEKIDAAILRVFGGYTIVGFELFNSLTSGK